MVVEVALQWCSDTFSDLLVGFVNSVKTIDGGTHIEGFKASHQPLHNAIDPLPYLVCQLHSCKALGLSCQVHAFVLIGKAGCRLLSCCMSACSQR